MTAWTDSLLAKLQVLLGDRASDGMQAVRKRDLVGVAITNKRQIGKGVITTAAIAPRSIVDDLIADAQLTARVFEEGIKPIELVDALPSLGNVQGRMVYLRSENALYRHTGSPVGSAGFTRQIDGTFIDPNSISTPALQANSVTTGKIAAGAVVASKVAAGAIQTQHMLVQGGNLISNPSFGTGDFSDWRPFSNPGFQFVESRDTAFVPPNAPAAFVCRHLHLSPGGISTFNGELAFDLPGKEAAARPVIAGEQYLVTVDAAKNTPSVALLSASVFWLYADGTTSQTDIIVTAVNDAWTIHSGSATAPVGAVGAWPFVFTNLASGGPVSVYWTNLSMRQRNAGNLIVDGAITAQKINVTSLSSITANVGTLTAGLIQSPNYNPGIAGALVNLTTGFAEFNSLQVRQDMLVAGAVSRQRVFQTNLPPSTSGTSALVVLATKTWILTDFAFAPFAVVFGETANPIRIDYAIKVNSVNGGVFARLRISPQYTTDGVNWINLSGFYVLKEIELRPGISSSDHTAFDIYDVTTQNVSQWIGLRVVATAVDGSGGFPIVNISSIQCIFQQISR